ncbi:hypothetical protein D3C79_877490 [compost metagenome]
MLEQPVVSTSVDVSELIPFGRRLIPCHARALEGIEFLCEGRQVLPSQLELTFLAKPRRCDCFTCEGILYRSNNTDHPRLTGMEKEPAGSGLQGRARPIVHSSLPADVVGVPVYRPIFIPLIITAQGFFHRREEG